MLLTCPTLSARGLRLAATSLWCWALALTVSREGNAWCRTTTCKGAPCAADANGCPSSGVKLAWRGGCIGYSVEAAGARLVPKAALDQAIRRAFQTWSQVDCGGGKYASITFAELPQSLCGDASYNADGANVNLVAFQDDDWKFKEDNNVAKTSVHFDTASGEIFDADLELNTAVNLFTTVDSVAAGDPAYLDVQTVVTHEIGHMLGLAHSERADSVMSAQYKQGTLAGRSLTDDDIAAVCAAYPPGRVAVCDPTPRGGLDTCSGTSTPALACQAAPQPPAGLGATAVAAVALLAWAVVRSGGQPMRRS